MGHVDALSRCHDASVVTETNNGRECLDAEISDGSTAVFDETAVDTEEKPGSSRIENSLVAVIDQNDVDFRLQVTQNHDPQILKYRNQLESESIDDYVLIDGLVYKKINEQTLFYVPAEMEENIIRLNHERIGHQSLDKTYAAIRENYWFPQTRKKTESHIANCVRCIAYATPARVTDRNLYNIPKKPVPFDTIHIDHFGPLPSLASKRKYILVVIDAFTKYVKLYPTNSTSTKEVNAALDKYFQYYSRPVRVISDRGSCFKSQNFIDFLQERNITHVKTAVASPQTNGQVERVNRVIKPMLAKLSEPIAHSDWSQKLLEVEYALNNSVHSTTKHTPSELLFGVQQKGPVVDDLTEYLGEKRVNERDLVKNRTSATEAIKQSQEYAAGRALQRKRKPKEYKKGDYVMILNVDTVIGTNKKFVPRYKGPYIVFKELGHDRYVIRDIENCQLTQLPYDGVVEANRMRKWLSQPERDEVNCSADESSTDNEDECRSEVSECDIDGFKGFTKDDCCPEARDDLDGFRGFQEEDTQTDVYSIDDPEVEVDRGRSRSQLGRVVSD